MCSDSRLPFASSSDDDAPRYSINGEPDFVVTDPLGTPGITR